MQEVVQFEAEQTKLPRKGRFKKLKVLMVMLCIGMSAVLAGHFVLSPRSEGDARFTRTITHDIDTMALLDNTFDWHEMTVDKNTVQFNGSRLVGRDLFNELDLLSMGVCEEAEGIRILTDARFDAETMRVYLTTTIVDFDGTIVDLDTIIGDAFVTENGDIDAKFDLDGEIVFMSEITGLDAIEGLFLRRLIRAIVVAVVVVVVVVVVVKTAGAALAVVGKVAAKKAAAKAAIASGKAITMKNAPIKFSAKILKTPAKVTQRGWSNAKINTAFKKGPVGTSNNGTATVFTSTGKKSTNKHIVVDNRTREILQISDRLDPRWLVDPRIVWF